MTNFKQTFKKEIVRKLQERLGIKNPMGVPRLTKIVVNSSMKDFLADRKSLEKQAADITLITGQKPKVTRARISVATFKLRKEDEIGLAVTLRGARMYEFFEKIVRIVLPRVRDFAGISPSALDGGGNLSIGFTENTVFPEIDPGKVDHVRSLQVTFVTNAGNNERAKVLFEEMGVPFRKDQK